MKSYDFVEMYKEKNNLRSDYSAAKNLGISRSAMSNYKHGRPLDEELAWKIAQDLGIDASDILVVMAAERSKSPEISKAFMKLCKLSKQSGRATANLLFPLAFISAVVHVCILCQIGYGKIRLFETVSADCA